MPNSTGQSLRIWLAIGPAGCGKSTLGAALASLLKAPFLDADAFHSPANLDKMRSGAPLDEEDRAPWLRAFGAALQNETANNTNVVGACSALKRRHRNTIRRLIAPAELVLVCPEIDAQTLSGRLAQRTGHFFPSSLLESQLHDFEPPQDDELTVRFPAHLTADEAAQACLAVR